MRPDRDRSHRSALWLSTMLTLVGSCGACNGAGLYTAGPPPSAALVDSAEGPGAHELAEVAAALNVTYLDAPNRRPLAAANLVLSLMLVVGSFMLGARNANARWFIVNALVANLVWIVADATLLVVRVESMRGLLAGKFATWIRAIEAPPPPITEAQARSMAQGWVTMFAASIIGVGIVKLLFHAFLIARTRSGPIAEFLSDRGEPLE